MKKFGYIMAALGVIAIAAPSIASAESIVIKQGGDRHDGGRAEFREHRDHGWRHDGARAEYREHRDHGWRGGRRHHDRVVIIKHRRHDY